MAMPTLSEPLIVKKYANRPESYGYLRTLMSSFQYKPLIEGDVDILSDPSSADRFNPVLGARKSLFKYDQEEKIIVDGPLVDGVKKVLD